MLRRKGAGRGFLVLCGQHLDGDGPLQPGVGGFVHFAHAPGPDGGLDLIRAEAGTAVGPYLNKEGPSILGGRRRVPCGARSRGNRREKWSRTGRIDQEGS